LLKLNLIVKEMVMLTHDLQPVIDYVYGGFFNKFGLTTPVKSKLLQNGDLLNTFKLTKQIAMDKIGEYLYVLLI